MIPELRHAIASDGVHIAWTSVGEGPVLIHLPGVPFSNIASEWRIPVLVGAFQRLASGVRLIQYDGRGTGHSQREVNDLSLGAMLRDLDAVVEAAGVAGQPIALLGFYHSATFAIAYAARHPERVSRIVLFGGAARGWSAMSGAEIQALLSLIERDWNVFVESIAHAWLGWGIDAEEGRLAAEGFRTATSPAVARATLQEASSVDVTALLPSVRCPVLVLHRRDGRVITLAASQELAAAMPDAQLELLPGTSATLFFEDTDAVVDRLVEFVGGLARPKLTLTQAAGSGRTRAVPTPSQLSPREVEVLRLIAAGESNAEIGRRLGVTVNTVERHVVNVYRKIDARGRADAAAFAVRKRLA